MRGVNNKKLDEKISESIIWQFAHIEKMENCLAERGYPRVGVNEVVYRIDRENGLKKIKQVYSSASKGNCEITVMNREGFWKN